MFVRLHGGSNFSSNSDSYCRFVRWILVLSQSEHNSPSLTLKEFPYA